MSARLKQIGDYVFENWVTSRQRRPYVLQVDNNTALFHCDGQGILAITSDRTDLRNVYSQIPSDFKVVPLLYGDGETFFRSAKSELVKKMEHREHVGSLWQYKTSTVEQGLLLNRLEREAVGAGDVHYFHPKPVMTMDVIGTYTLKPFVFDYTRHANYPADKPSKVTSRQYFHWDMTTGQRFVIGTFALENDAFVEHKRKPLELGL